MGFPWSRRARTARREARLRSIEGFRAEWADELRVTTTERDTVTLALRPEGRGEWVEVDLGTGDVDDLIGLLAKTRDEADPEHV
jgi:hypothetical protein